MAVSMEDVKKLREFTKAGMMDCKNALEKAGGNYDEALKILKEKGLADAKKRSDRETKEGGVYIKASDKRVVIIQIGCETDFVSKNEIYVKAKDGILEKMMSTGNADVKSYDSEIQEVVSVIKENIEFKNARVIDLKDNQCVFTYIHGNNRIGVAVVFELSDLKLKDNEKFREYANNICLHITANSPFFIKKDDIPANEVAEQKEIFTKQMEGSGKPANIVESIVNGKLSKHFQEVCLMDQKYVKDDKLTIEKYTESVAKELNAGIKIADFVRYVIGI